jgi:TIR domain
MPISGASWDFFIIHASPDKPSAEELFRLLSPQHRVFLDATGIRPGDEWGKVLDTALQTSRISIILISRKLDDAYFALSEIVQAIDLNRKNPLGRRIVPVVLSPGDEDAKAMYGLWHIQRLDKAACGGMTGVAAKLREL